MKKVLKIMLSLIPKKKAAYLIVEILDDFAKKTDNKLDDSGVEVIRMVVKKAFGPEKKEKK